MDCTCSFQDCAKTIIATIYTMFAPARRRCAQWALRPSVQQSDSIPTFLLPAFAQTPSHRNFTTSSSCQSKIGSLPLSVPEGVTLNIVAPSAKGRGTRTQAMSTVHIKGPLAELSMDVPPYININQDPKLSGPTLSIQDSTDAKQKAMWGKLKQSRVRGKPHTNDHRNHTRIPPKPHPRCQRRTQRYSPFRRCRLPCLG
jgi:hypothetical protein